MDDTKTGFEAFKNKQKDKNKIKYVNFLKNTH